MVIAALINICYEFTQLRRRKNYINMVNNMINQRIPDLQRRIETFIAINREIIVQWFFCDHSL